MFTLAVLALLQVAVAKDSTVGDETGWTFPPPTDPNFYDEWAAKQSFAPGDNLGTRLLSTALTCDRMSGSPLQDLTRFYVASPCSVRLWCRPA